MPNPILIINILPLFFLFHLSLSQFSYHPTDLFFINCGSSSNATTTDDHRVWISDADANLNFLPQNMTIISSEAKALEQSPSIYQVPYMTARIFHYQFTYTFHLSPGLKFLRLHFYAAKYSGDFNGKQSFFTVTANGYTLLNNFSVFLSVSATKRPVPFLVKEFIINVDQNHMLNVTFSPSSNSYSFVNGIEIVSMPDNLYFGEHDLNHPIKDITSSSIYNLDKSNTALETMYRLNIGGTDVSGNQDLGMFRVWSQDANFILGAATGETLLANNTVNYTSIKPAYSAPVIIYTTARKIGYSINMTWYFSVDTGFSYMLRLHFCDFISDMENQRVFTIFIGNETAEPEFDIIYNSHGRGIPVVRDYVTWVPSPNGRSRKKDLWLAIIPYLGTKPEYGEAILNGLEIFKLNSTDGNLAGPNPAEIPSNIPMMTPLEMKKKSKCRTTPFAVLGGMVGIVVLSIVILLTIRQQKIKDSDNIALPSFLCRRFSLKELKIATKDFEKNFVIGIGGFGNVYKGYIDNGAMTVAIKRLNPSSHQGANEFKTEIEILSKLRHFHLVSLIGYCDEHGEMILVYDYMANGTLRDHLYKTENPPLSWKQRLQICIGAAKGLHYLHAGAEHSIIHRDVKSTNILLDEKWVAKVSDFGLSKFGPTSGIESHVSTMVKGSVGYVDPEYYKKQQLTDKSDVYSFGVVLFEVWCARPAMIPTLPKEEVSLVEWVQQSYKKGNLDEIIDRNLKGEIGKDCLRSYVEIGFSCLKNRGIERPQMSDIVWRLEFALQLQETAITNAHSLNKPQFPLLLHGGEVTKTIDDAEKKGFSSWTLNATTSCSNIRME